VFELYEKHFLDHFPRRKTTPTIRANKVVLSKKLQAAVDRGDTTWQEIEEKVKLYAGCDSVRQGFVVLPATWCSETNDNGPGWSWEYEYDAPLSAKPISEWTAEEFLRQFPPDSSYAVKRVRELAIYEVPKELRGRYGLLEVVK